MKVTVAIVTHDRPNCVDRLLDSLRTQVHSPDEVIVVNNGRNASTAAVVRKHDASFARSGIDLRLYDRAGTNLPAGRNAALEAANSDVICFLDDDTVASESWLDGIRRGYELDDDVVAVGGPAIAVDETLTPQVEIDRSARNHNSINRYGETHNLAKRWIPPRPVCTDLLQGANMSFEVSTLESIGGFDPSYRGYPLFEDTDVMARYWKRNEKLIYHPDALVYHERSGHSTGYYWYWFTRNAIRFRRKNFPETYHRSLVRLLAWGGRSPLALWRQLAIALVHRDRKRVGRTRAIFHGFVDGIVRDRRTER